jgi:hypothetical protein
MTPPRFFSFLSVCLVFLLALPPAQAQDEQSGLRILVVEGEGALNNVKLKTLKPVLVEVQFNGMPAPGASVTFILPNQGPSGTFLNGSATTTVNTDAQGRATSSAINPNGATGAMPIRVSASYSGQTASATVHQTNVNGVSSSGGGISRGTKILIVVAIAGAAVGAGVALGRGSSSNPTMPPPPAITITAGTPVVGGPSK